MSEHNFRISDLGVTCSPLVPGQTALADAGLPVEILSPGDQSETWSNVRAYTTIPSVRELLVLHTSRIATEVLRRGPDRSWLRRFELMIGRILSLESIALRVALAELYALSGLQS